MSIFNRSVIQPLGKGFRIKVECVQTDNGFEFTNRLAHNEAKHLSKFEEAIACTDEVMELLGCKTVADLQKVEIKDLIDTSGVLELRVWAERDGSFLPEDPFEAYANGAAKDISPDGTEKVWPLYDLENKQVMIFDEDNIHAEKESERQIIDWDRTYFLTKYYSI